VTKRGKAQAATVLICTYATLVCAVPVAAEQKNKDQKITRASNESLVIMRVPTFPFDYTMSLSRDGKTGFMTRVYLLPVRSDTGYQYVSRALKPGTYVMTALYQQSGWQSCFSNNTPKFTIEAGKVYYFGTLNVEQSLTELQQDAIKRGSTALPQGGLTTQWDPKSKLVWKINGEAETTDLVAFLAKKMPKTNVKPIPLEVTYSNLTVSATERAIQVCG
jgi:hypothetical protein